MGLSKRSGTCGNNPPQRVGCYKAEMRKGRLTLKDAIKSGRLQEFAAQEEARGIDNADRARLRVLMDLAIKPQPSKRQTSRSPSGGGSRGKRTR